MSHEIPLDDQGWNWTRDSKGSVDALGQTVYWSCQTGSDYWRLTASGIIADNGHAYCYDILGDFRLEATFAASLDVRYDQVGLIALKSPAEWFKCNYERDGDLCVGGVLTRGTSNWSRAPAAGTACLALVRSGDTVEALMRMPASEWSMLRQFTMVDRLSVGIYSASPAGRGFAATATAVSLSTPSSPE
jgi:regulation of enolase protein 1 (concanavalin A-like superfamily)